MAAPVLLHECEHWELGETDERRIERVEMRFLRKVAGRTVTRENK
jgi:hypothetical protein